MGKKSSKAQARELELLDMARSTSYVRERTDCKFTRAQLKRAIELDYLHARCFNSGKCMEDWMPGRSMFFDVKELDELVGLLLMDPGLLRKQSRSKHGRVPHAKVPSNQESLVLERERMLKRLGLPPGARINSVGRS